MYLYLEFRSPIIIIYHNTQIHVVIQRIGSPIISIYDNTQLHVVIQRIGITKYNYV